MITTDNLIALIEEEKLPYWRILEYRTNNVLATNQTSDDTKEAVRMLEERLETLKGYGRVTVKITKDRSGKNNPSWSGNWANANQYHVELVNGNGSEMNTLGGLPQGIGFKDYLDLNNKLMETRFELEKKKMELETPRGTTGELMDILKTVKDLLKDGGNTNGPAQLSGIDYDVLITDWQQKAEDEKYRNMAEKEGKEMNETLADLMTKVDIRAIHRLMKALNENPEHAITALKKIS